MNILVLGSGGREHALSWKIAQSPLCTKLFIAPGNPGTAALGENIALNANDSHAVHAAVEEYAIDLVVVASDEPLAAGIVDALSAAGILAFGPTQGAAEIEWSKSYAKELMKAAGVPTAASEIFGGYEAAHAYIETHPLPIVVKASGLAGGKGVTIAQTLEEADAALKECFLDAKFGISGSEVVIEEYMEGFEFSVHAICAETDALMFPSSMDHKRIFDGDQGPNTGGMGTVTPLPGISPEVMAQIKETIVLPTLRELSKRGRSFSGLLYPGIMLTKDGPKVIEFNARFGDPEAQVYMRLMKSDIVPVLLASARGDISSVSLEWNEGAAACVVMASSGYPDAYEKGKEITGIEAAEDGNVVVFHAGTKRENGLLLTSGGRVLHVTATGTDLQAALAAAYAGVKKIYFEGAQYRSDIGAKARG